MNAPSTYPGHDLDLFSLARNWKAYLKRQIGPYIGKDVLEVGAGNGGTTAFLSQNFSGQWLCLEPDYRLYEMLIGKTRNGDLPNGSLVRQGTLADLNPKRKFDTILYIDVLEHIEDDRNELAVASDFLIPGGHLVVMSPAHHWLYSELDRAHGHYRRYTDSMLRKLSPEDLDIAQMRYLDSVGVLASLANRLLMKRELPSPKEIKVWDQFMVPISALFDPLSSYTLGKSILAVWRKKRESSG